MRENVIINGKSYVPAEITFGTACKLERMGLNIFEAGDKPLSLLGGYVAVTIGCGLDEAIEILDKHLATSGDYEEIFDTMIEAINESDFFQGQGKGKKKTSKK